GGVERVRVADHPLDRDEHPARDLRKRPQHRPPPHSAPGRLRRGAMPGRRDGRQRRAGARLPVAARGAQPHVPQPRRADRAGGARGTARSRPRGGNARPERGRDADARRDRPARRRADRGPRRRAAAGAPRARTGGDMSIRLESVTKIYPNGVKAVDDITLEINPGEFVVLVGPSGCGKSTVLRMIAGLEDVSDGAIFIEDVDITDTPPQQPDIAMVFQNYALYPHMTVKDNLAYGLKLRKMPKAEWQRRVQETAKTLGLDELLDRKPSALSGGQRQRVAMGRAIVREPKAFLMDEPLSNLDAKLRVSMRAELARLHERLGVTTVYVTHDQVEAMPLGQRVAVLRDGILQQLDTPQRLFHHPSNLFVAAFIGSPSMNLVEADVDGATLRFGSTALELPS